MPDPGWTPPRFQLGPRESSQLKEQGALIEPSGACRRATPGGRLSVDIKSFPAAAQRGAAIDARVRSLIRLVEYGFVGWMLCAALMAILLHTIPAGTAIAIHAVAAPLIFTGIAMGYFRRRGAWDPVPTAIAFTAIVAVFDAALVAGLVPRDFAMFTSFAGTWLPFGLIFLATWVTGLVAKT